MLIVEENFPFIDIHQLVRCIISNESSPNGTVLGNFLLLDVNDREMYNNQHIITAEHYNKLLIARLNYESEILAKARKEEKTLVIYGNGASNVTSTLFQRGFRAILLNGDISTFKKMYPNGLLSGGGEEEFDLVALDKRFEFLKATRWGKGRILHQPLPLRRAKSADSAQRQRQLRALSAKRKPWIP
ncbi:unnamed protein product, partial [Mesorhabditis belari]|uniref:Rhodanese domain-containing protein n=1 Tax=Mesorhabditis belari TaxID=2138241 RepID=A0AAF3EYG0_9BILA